MNHRLISWGENDLTVPHWNLVLPAHDTFPSLSMRDAPVLPGEYGKRQKGVHAYKGAILKIWPKAFATVKGSE